MHSFFLNTASWTGREPPNTIMAVAALMRTTYLPMILSVLVSWALCVSVDSILTAAVQVDVIMKPGSSLTPSSPAPLYSSSSRFKLSFVSPPKSSNLFLAISYVLNRNSSFSADNAEYPVWVANRDSPVTSSASLTLSLSGKLLLSDPTVSADHPVWTSNTLGLGVVQAELLESGNLVLLNSSSGYVWESFHYPTDTLLPGQSFNAASLQSLISNKKSDSFASGRFSLGFSPEGFLELTNWDSLVAHWTTRPRQITAVNFDKDGNITFYNSSSSVDSAYVSSDHGEEDAAIRRMTLDMDGNMRLYTWDAVSTQWKAVWMTFTDVCHRVQGLCGRYGVCTYNPVQPTCVCPQGFSVVDATDLASGCAANFDMESGCTNSTKLMEIPHVDFPFNDYLSFLSSSLEECKDKCLSSCECMAAVYWQSQGHCWLKKIVENGSVRWSQMYRSFLKISGADPSVSRPVLDETFKWSSLDLWQGQPAVEYMKREKHFSTVIGLAILLVVQTLGFAASVAVLIIRSKSTRSRHAQLDEELQGGSLHVFSYEELKAASENFSHKVGAGGFGTVYKGQLQNGKVVAIKQVEGVCNQQEQQFRAEITTLGRIHHINLLPLVGFCCEGNHRLLVFEYMEKGSLAEELFQQSSKPANPEKINKLGWSTRFQICLGVARGLHYLHSECSDCILHCDIKPENVLLDASYNPKVADFGLAYLYSRNHTLKMSKARGTRGYLAPEWVFNLPITAKADVYSYGMLIMEVLSGRRNFDFSESCLMDERWFFPEWAQRKGIEEVVDTSLDRLSVDWDQAEIVLKVGFACIQADMNARPSMGKVVKMLEGKFPVQGTSSASLFTSLFIDEDKVANHASASTSITSSSSSFIAVSNTANPSA